MTADERWRLVLGRYANKQIPSCGHAGCGRREAALDYLYGREYAGRGARDADAPGPDAEIGPGSLDPSAPGLVGWLGEVRELFPRETVEVVERHALDRYGLTELVTDPDVLERLEPSQELLQDLADAQGAARAGRADRRAQDRP